MNKPSSTITAAFLAGAGMTAFWALVENFTSVQVSPTVVSTTTTFISALIGYYKRENVLPLQKPIDQVTK